MAIINSGDIIRPGATSDLQSEVTDDLNRGLSSVNDQISRGAIGPEHLYDGAVITARNFEVIEDTKVVHHINYPETVRGPHWETGPVGISAASRHRWYWHAQERKSWSTIGTYGSTARGTESAPKVVKTTTSPSVEVDLWRVDNQGKGFSLMFYLNARLKYPLRWNKNDKKWSHPAKVWGGCRMWTGVVYYMKPNPDVSVQLEWSPDHMLGCHATEFNLKNSDEAAGGAEARGEASHTYIEAIHAYQDVQFINQDFVDRLALMNGHSPATTPHDFTLRGSALFGWRFVGGSDRWNMIENDDDITSLSLVLGEGGTTGGHKYPGNGMPFTVASGNVGFMALRYDGESPI